MLCLCYIAAHIQIIVIIYKMQCSITQGTVFNSQGVI